MVALLQNRQGLSDVLKADSYVEPALVPASPWLEADAPFAPTVTLMAMLGTPGLWRISISLPANSKPAARWAVWLRYGVRWVFRVSVAPEFTVAIRHDLAPGVGAAELLSAIAVSAIDRVGQESPRVVLKTNPS